MKRKLQLILDICMVIGILPLYDQYIASIFFHEILGCIVLVGMICHILINIKTFIGMQKKFIKISPGARFGFIVDVLLLITFSLEAISGVFISKKLFSWISTGNTDFVMIHFWAGAISIILLGIHIGLHICRKKIPLILAVLITIASLGLGGLGIANARISERLTLPFAGIDTKESYQLHEDHQRLTHPRKNKAGQGKGQGQGQGKKSHGKGYEKRSNMTWPNRILIIFEYLGMIFSFAMVTNWIARCLRKRTK